MFCIDGRFKEFQAVDDLSTDGSREVVCGYPNAILVDAGGIRQVEKRNRYFELAAEHDVDLLLMIDSDEYVIGDWHLFKRNAEDFALREREGPSLYHVAFKMIKRESEYTFPHYRLYYRPGFIRLLTGVHNDFFDITCNPPKSIPQTRNPPVVEGIRIHQDDIHRNEDWLERMFNHQKWQIIYESQWKLGNSRIMREHVEENGYDSVELLLESHPHVKLIMEEYQYAETLPKAGYYANPELVDYFKAIRHYFTS
jgi:hypothetical protein